MPSSRGIFPTQGSNPCLRHCRRILYHLSHQGNPWILERIAYPFSRVPSRPRNRTRVSCIAVGFFTSWATREAPTLCRGICKIHTYTHTHTHTYSHTCISLTFLSGLYLMTLALYPTNNLSYKAHLSHNWIKILLKNCRYLGLLWWAGGSDSTLPMQRAWVQWNSDGGVK